MEEHKAVELMRALGVDVEIGTETYEAMLEHPTIGAFVKGDISMGQALFVEEYLANGFNATAAAKSAKYKAFERNGFTSIGSGILRSKKVKELIARRIAERALSANEVLDRYREIADGSIADFIDPDQMQVDLRKASELNKLHLLKDVKITREGDVQIKMRDQDHALDQIARSLGVFEKDNAAHLPPEVIALLGLSPQELEARKDAYKDMQEDWEG